MHPETQGDVVLKVDAAIRLAQDCRSLARDVIVAFLAKKRKPLEGHTIVFLTRATTALESVELLANAGLSADATSVSRTIMETLIDLRYILKEDTRRRFELFFGHENVRDWHEVQALERLYGKLPHTTMEAMKIIKARYDAVKDWYPSEYHWCVKSIRRRAIETDGEHGQHFYDLAYTEGCSTSHSGPKGLRHAYSVIEDEANINITLLLGTRDRSSRSLEFACLAYILVLGNVIEFCGRQAQFDEPQAALLARLNALVALQDE